MKRFILSYFLFIIVAVLAVYGFRKYESHKSKQSVFTNEKGITYTSRIEGKKYQVYVDNKWQDMTIKGVNLGVTQPGSFPGELAINKETYLRWFQYISDMKANTIRVYTLQNTDFYEALCEFNLNNPHPLYLIHGVWVNEDAVSKYNNAFNSAIYNEYIKDCHDIIDAIHGNAVIKPEAGRAGGAYTKDVSKYVIGWIFGIEFNADFVNKTNEMNADHTVYNGKYLYTKDASPFEVFLAKTGDKAISYEAEKYRMIRPAAFTNWLTTDPLDHPNEPDPANEDGAVINVEHIKWRTDFETGMFASYHVYPYYPDFLNYDTKYIAKKGRTDTYKAYLKELTAYHTMPVLVSEVGLPTSRGIAHRSIYSGYNQGYLNEKQQGNYLCNLIDDIMDTKCLGFLIFSWQDEWFKRSWNTMDLENADRRPFWLNVETGEKTFGLLSFDPGKKDTKLYVDGSYEDWSEDDILLKDNGYSLSVQEDSSYLYLLVDTKSFNFNKDTIYIPIDTVKNQGNYNYKGFRYSRASDFVIRIQGKNHSEVLVDPYYDVFYYQNAVLHNMIDRIPDYTVKNSGRFSPIRLALNHKLYLPETKKTIPFESFNTGKLTYGIANPTDKNYNSLSDFYYKDGKIEIRIPWGLLSFSDPSTGEIIGNLYSGNSGISFTKINNISFGLAANKKEEVQFKDYALRGWNKLTYHERLKQSYSILQKKLSAIN